MIDHDKEFEAKLAAMRPTRPSADLVKRIGRAVEAGECDADVAPPIYGFAAWRAVAGLAAMLTLAAMVWLLARPGTPVQIDTPPVHVIAGSNPTTDIRLTDPTLPTAGNYLRAMRESPEAVDALLQKHAGLLMPPTRDLNLSDLMKDTSS
ncbi:MAG: hypothetical protein GC159_21970 [Phycisphaera sp.]|nr:hypothetical protein [Phycisphaera sp.]